MSSFATRMVRAAMLDANIYEEIEADQGALRQAMAVVVLAGVASGIGNFRLGYKQFMLGILGSLFSWFIWALITYYLGTKAFPEPQTKSNLGELLRTIGFTSAPGTLSIFKILPGTQFFLVLGLLLWQFAAMVVAVRQALDYTSILRAVGVCLLGFIIRVVLMLILI